MSSDKGDRLQGPAKGFSGIYDPYNKAVYNKVSPTLLSSDYKHCKYVIEEIEDMQTEIIWLGNICPTKNRNNPNQGRVYAMNGIAPCLNTIGGGNLQPMILVESKERKEIKHQIVCEQRCDEGIRFFQDGCCGTIRTIDGGGDKRVLEQIIEMPTTKT